ncbi:MAG: family 43 glycosylhydrolase, partial [Clostridia bacterium]|nr:family 43 glycosylhydrolase [Clostridia bacterium]
MATDLAKAGFNVTTVYTADATTDLSAYADNNMIVVGEAGETAAGMTSALSGTSRHRIKTETTSTRFHTYLVGVNDYSLTQAIQRFYSEIVVNGEYQKPAASDTTLKSGGTNRDPGIIYKDGTYYYYENQSGNFQYGIRTSTDKLTWTSAGVAYKYDAGGENASYFYGFTSQEEMEAKGIPNAQYWAPEVHEYNGAYYMFATYRHKDNLNRGTAIFKADSPAGPFIPWSNGFVTPEDQDCIDGTLYVDADGTPYIVYVNEWTNRGANATEAKSRMDYVQLSADLSTTKGEHYTLFQADDPTWTDYGIVDGPWLYTCEDGTLLMIWSNKVDRNYAVGVAKSSNGKI